MHMSALSFSGCITAFCIAGCLQAANPQAAAGSHHAQLRKNSRPTSYFFIYVYIYIYMYKWVALTVHGDLHVVEQAKLS
jgi:hypothetical protein